ncbi:hypothetical protein Tco_0377468 [Tanacetum coccineum]
MYSSLLMSLISSSCLSSLEESLPSVPSAYAVAMPDVLGYGSRVHTHDHGGSEAPDGSPDSIQSNDGSNGDGIGGGDECAGGAVHLARCSPAEGGDSKIGGDGDGVAMARSLSQTLPMVYGIWMPEASSNPSI